MLDNLGMVGEFLKTMNSLIVFDHDPYAPPIEKSQTVDDTTFKFYLTQTQRFVVGFVEGCSEQYAFNAETEVSSVCTSKLTNAIQIIFGLYDYKEIWLPANILKINSDWAQVEQDWNSAYAYCNFNQFYEGFARTLLGDQLSNE